MLVRIIRVYADDLKEAKKELGVKGHTIRGREYRTEVVAEYIKNILLSIDYRKNVLETFDSWEK